MHFSTRETLTLILIVNVTAAGGAFLFGYVQDRLGHIPTLVTTMIWLGLSPLFLRISRQGPALFWTRRTSSESCLGRAKSAARGTGRYLSPRLPKCRFFGLWGLVVKLSRRWVRSRTDS